MSDDESDVDFEPMVPASSAAAKMRCAGPVFAIAGMALGIGLACFSSVVPQEGVAAALVLFFAVSNCMPLESSSLPLLGMTCSMIFMFLGYSVGIVFGVCAGYIGDTEIGWPGKIGFLRFPLFTVLVMIFHIVEFTFTVTFHPQNVQFWAFMLTPVPYGGYSIAMISAIAEYWLEHFLLINYYEDVLSMTAGAFVLLFGFVLAFSGWALRAAALFTGQWNFTHIVQSRKRDGHHLVTGGVYQLCRHPGYLGWFLWSVCTQLVLANPICLLLYTFVSWKFFAGRIPPEEEYLVEFFGDEYLEYAQKVPCGLPCISEL